MSNTTLPHCIRCGLIQSAAGSWVPISAIPVLQQHKLLRITACPVCEKLEEEVVKKRRDLRRQMEKNRQAALQGEPLRHRL